MREETRSETILRLMREWMGEASKRTYGATAKEIVDLIEIKKAAEALDGLL